MGFDPREHIRKENLITSFMITKNEKLPDFLNSLSLDDLDFLLAEAKEEMEFQLNHKRRMLERPEVSAEIINLRNEIDKIKYPLTPSPVTDKTE